MRDCANEGLCEVGAEQEGDSSRMLFSSLVPHLARGAVGMVGVNVGRVMDDTGAPFWYQAALED